MSRSEAPQEQHDEPPGDQSLQQIAESYPKQAGQLAHQHRLPPEQAETVPAEAVIDAELADRLGHPLYTHQATALDHLHDGKHVSIATSTSSGKTLIYALYAANQYMDSDGKATMLFLYPTKALARDQQAALEELYSRLGIDMTVEVYDGDTPSSRKRYARSNADIIISNFAGINRYLSYHNLWRYFFENLSLIALDEAHTYTGVHGMHVSWIVRRLRRLIDYYGSDPQMTCTTATIGNPREHARALTGVDVEVVDEDGSPTGQREIGVWRPPSNPEDPQEVRPAGHEASDLLGHLTANELQTLMFCRSRKETELNVERTLNASTTPAEANIKPYNAGHNKTARRNTEDQLKSGALDAVVSTNALELGIDIGSVDATITVGYPGTRQSFWQQAGRAGREQRDALSFYIPRDAPLDQYIADNPKYLLGEGNIEDAVVDLQNNSVYLQHLRCAAEELPLTPDDRRWFGDRLEDAVKMQCRLNNLSGDLEMGAQANCLGQPQREVSVYATDDESFAVRCPEDDEFQLEDIGRERAHRDYHPGAVFLHQGQQYKVTEFVDEPVTKRITVKPVDVDYFTVAMSDAEITELSINNRQDLGRGMSLCTGQGTVSVLYDQFKRKNISTGKDIGQELATGLDPITMQTDLMWIEFSERLARDLAESFPTGNDSASPVQGGLQALVNGCISMAPLELRMAKDDIEGHIERRHSDTGQPTMFIYDVIDGGLGFSHALADRLCSVVERVNDRLVNCSCDTIEGCPACTMDDSSTENDDLHKPAAISLTNHLNDLF